MIKGIYLMYLYMGKNLLYTGIRSVLFKPIFEVFSVKECLFMLLRKKKAVGKGFAYGMEKGTLA